MNIRDGIIARRSIRKFTQKPIEQEKLRRCITLGRLYASAANAQPVRFACISREENRNTVFEALNWAKFLPDFSIAETERPTAYILLLSVGEKSAFFDIDAGGAAANIMLAAQEDGIASCLLKIARPELIQKAFDFGEHIPVYAVALGYPALESHIVPWEGDQRYCTDSRGNFTVPKRRTEDVLIWSDEK